MDKTKWIEQLKNHPAMEFANDAITLQAIRSGTKGYQGEEDLVQWFEKSTDEMMEEMKSDLVGKIEGLTLTAARGDDKEMVEKAEIMQEMYDLFIKPKLLSEIEGLQAAKEIINHERNK